MVTLERSEFLKWLENHGDTDIVGYACDYRHCPIAEYLRHCGYDGVAVGYDTFVVGHMTVPMPGFFRIYAQLLDAVYWYAELERSPVRAWFAKVVFVGSMWFENHKDYADILSWFAKYPMLTDREPYELGVQMNPFCRSVVLGIIKQHAIDLKLSAMKGGER